MRASIKTLFVVSLLILVAQGIALWSFGQPPICECGYVKVWESIVLSSGNSQHLTDWYTPSHVIHGVLFYALLWLLFPRLSVGKRFLAALALEAGWEVVENTPWLIEHYRQQALAQGYVGDSILNSLSDTLAMALGFFAARRLPIATSVAAVILLEVFVAYSIRDNLTLNVVGFFYQFPAITEWQSGG
jgi:hypothetical protein